MAVDSDKGKANITVSFEDGVVITKIEGDVAVANDLIYKRLGDNIGVRLNCINAVVLPGSTVQLGVF